MLGVILSDDTQGHLRKSKERLFDRQAFEVSLDGGWWHASVCQSGMENGMLSKGVLYLCAYCVDDDHDDKLYLISA